MVGNVAWRWRRGIPLLAVVSLAAACSGTPAETTVAATAVTTTSVVTTTTPPPTTATSTTTSTTTTTTIALVSDPIEGVPDELVALIGAPMPEFDRTIAANEDGTANVEDIQRWLDEWDAWQVWVNANRPIVTADVLAIGYVPGSVFDQILVLSQQEPDTRLLGKRYALIYVDDTSDLGDGFQVGRSLVISATPTTVHSYKVVDGALEHEEGPHVEPPTFALRLLGSTSVKNETSWRVNVLEIAGQS